MNIPQKPNGMPIIDAGVADRISRGTVSRPKVKSMPKESGGNPQKIVDATPFRRNVWIGFSRGIGHAFGVITAILFIYFVLALLMFLTGSVALIRFEWFK